MATTITLRDDIYKKLLTIKGNLSFSEIIEKLLGKKGIEELFGALRDEICEADVRKLFEERNRARARI